MIKNVGTRDATLRTYGSVVLAVLAIFVVDIAWLRIVFAVLAAVLAATAFLGVCPLYRLIKRNTCVFEGEVTVTKAPATTSGTAASSVSTPEVQHSATEATQTPVNNVDETSQEGAK